jgi:hypothetical protein
MAKPKVIVDRVRSVTRADQLVGGMPPPKGSNFAVVRLTGSTVMLDLNAPTGRPWERLLEDFRLRDAYVYLEVDASKNIIVSVLCPRSVFVQKVSTEFDPKRGNRVDLEISAAVHYVSPGNAIRDTLLQTLRAAQLLRRRMLVTEDVRGREIIDARPDPRPVAWSPEKWREPGPSREKRVAARAVPLSEAQRFFDLVASQVHIPFTYPDNGCWARAHEMVRLILEESLSAPIQKTWLYGTLNPTTRNHPDCEETWAWHVAPTIDVQDGSNVVPYVIDPSLFFDGPVLRADWVAAQSPTATLQVSDVSLYTRVYDNVSSTSDEHYIRTQDDLACLRACLEARIILLMKAPPYCP